MELFKNMSDDAMLAVNGERMARRRPSRHRTQAVLADEAAPFEYDPAFVGSGVEISPLAMPLSRRIYSFPEVSRTMFHGLPGLLADSPPDRFGNALINAWLARQGGAPETFNAVERLCYRGKRGMEALEFEPAIGPKARKASRVQHHRTQSG